MTAKNKGTRWTEDEIAFLEREYGKSPTREIAEALGRSYEGVCSKALRLKLVYDPNRPKEVAPGMKYCKQCGEVLPLTEFWSNSSKSGTGTASWCKTCSNKIRQESYIHKHDKKAQEKFKAEQERLKIREEVKNSKSFTCECCGKTMSGKNFDYYTKKDNTVDKLCRVCRMEKREKTNLKNVKDGKAW